MGSDISNYPQVIGLNGCIAAVKTHARKLSSISLNYPIKYVNDVHEGQMTDLIVSYGEQLVNLEIADMSAESWAKIIDSCPRVQIALRNKPNVFASIDVLWQNLRELKLELHSRPLLFGGFGGGFVGGFNAVNAFNNDDDGAFNSDREAKLRKAMEKCYGLHKLTLSCGRYIDTSENVQLNVIQAMLPFEMKCLEELELRPLVDPASLTHIATVTSQLKSVKFSCPSPMATSAIEAIVRANRGLEDVEIREYRRANEQRTGAETAESVKDLVSLFSGYSTKGSQVSTLSLLSAGNTASLVPK